MDANKQARQQLPSDDMTNDGFSQDVARFMTDLGSDDPATVLQRDAPAQMLRDGFDTATPAGVIAERIKAWCDARDSERSAPSTDPVDRANPARRRIGLREAAGAVLTASRAIEGDTMPEALRVPLNALQVVLRQATPRTSRPVGQPREGTKQMHILAMLHRPEGATVAQIAEAMAWQAHTVRGFFVGVQKRLGVTVTVEKVSASGEPGGKAPTIYRIAESG